MLKEQIKVLVLLLIYVFMAYNAFASFYKIGYFRRGRGVKVMKNKSETYLQKIEIFSHF